MISAVYPGFEVFLYEFVIVEMRIKLVDSVDLFTLSGGESFVGIETPDTLHNALTSEDLMNTCDAALESVCGIKECCVAVCNLCSESEKLCGDVFLLGEIFEHFIHFAYSLCPYTPVSEKTAYELYGTCFAVFGEFILCKKVNNDVVIIPVKRAILSFLEENATALATSRVW